MRISDWSSDVCSSDLILVADPAFGTTIWPRDRFEAAWGDGIILAAREGIEVAAEHFGDIPDWQIRPKAPIAQGVDRSGLATFTLRSEARRVGKECVSTCRSRWSPSH